MTEDNDNFQFSIKNQFSMMQISKREYGGIFWIHLILIGLAYTSFLWLDWRIILAGVVLLQVYYRIRGGCDLTFAEFGDDKDTTFAWYYLRKIIPNLDQKKTKIFIRIVLPVVLVVGAFYLQEVGSFAK